jgi:site-specific DNA-methyltransferase (adenine-specific)
VKGSHISSEPSIQTTLIKDVLHLENRIVQGDCADLFAQIPDESIDLILTDPPYKDYQSNRPVAREKVKKIFVNTFDLELFIRESERVLKPGCHFYCWCDHLTFPGIFDAIKARREGISKKKAAHRFLYKNCLIWVKNNHGAGDLQGNYAPQHELVIYASKGRTRPLKGKRPSNVFFDRDDQGKIRFFSKVSNYRYAHGTSKPHAILERMIKSSSTRGEIVFDPYGGSMSTAEAAMRQGRRFVMGELEADHCANGFERLKAVREELLVEGYEGALLTGPFFDPPLEPVLEPEPVVEEVPKKRDPREPETLPLDLPDLLKA